MIAARPGSPWRDLALIVLMRLSMGVQFQMVGSFSPVLVGDLVADYAQLGTLIGIYMLPGLVIALPAGWLTARLGDRRILVAGLLCMAGGAALLAVAPGFWVALAARVTGGVGGVLFSIVCAKMVLDRFSGRALAPAMGTMLAAWPIGIALSLVVLPPFGEAWRVAVGLSGLFSLALVPLAFLLPGAPPRREAALALARLKPGETAPIVAAGVVWATYNAAYAVALSFAPTFLVERGFGVAEAGVLSSLIGWAIVPLLPLGGLLAERLGRPILAAAACTLGMAAALAALVAGAPAALCLIAFGLFAAPPASLVMAEAGRALSPGSRAFGMGLYYALFYAGMGGLPPVAGWARDATGDPAAPMLAAVLFCGAAIAGLAAMARFRRTA